MNTLQKKKRKKRPAAASCAAGMVIVRMIVRVGQTVVVLIVNALDIPRENAGIRIRIKDLTGGENQN